MNPFGYNLNSRCRNRAKRFSNRTTSDTFGYNERSEVVFSRGDAKNAEAIYVYDKIGDLLKYLSLAITNFYSANNHNKYTTILRASASPREINPQCDIDGNLIFKSGTLADFFRHRFSTKYFDTETKLYYYGYRFYHPTLMRWHNRDPIEENSRFNLYGFCENNIYFGYDKLGLYRWVAIYYSRLDQAEFKRAAETYKRQIEKMTSFNPKWTFGAARPTNDERL